MTGPMPDPIAWTATEAELQRDLIAEWLRNLAATASSEQARGAYLYAADGVEGGEWRVDQRKEAC